MNKIRWAICDDISSVCKSFELALQRYADLEYIGSACNSKECISLCMEKKPDILLLDIQMEDETSGISLIPAVKRTSPNTKIIMLTSYGDENYIFSSFSVGADNYITKSIATEELYKAMTNIFNEQYILQAPVMQALVSHSQQLSRQHQSLLYIITIMSTLSRSEFEILKEIHEGKTYSQIAKSRFVEIGTIKKQSSRILRKFNSKSMKELIEKLNYLNVFDIYNSHNITIEDISDV